jgi:hypothetical protein
MKKIALCLMITILSLTCIPLQSFATTINASSSLVDTKPAESAEAKALLLRLDEINAMEKSKMKASEKKNLRMEVRSTKNKLREIGGGIYLSAGAVVLILILLIILL